MLPINDSWSETAICCSSFQIKLFNKKKTEVVFTLSYLKTAIYDSIQKQHNKWNCEKLRQLSHKLKWATGSPATSSILIIKLMDY
ncbi:hypothetical protein J4731_17140 [Providencia rettgeri]|nr:hypothetical protein [Providencia rettgeri]